MSVSPQDGGRVTEVKDRRIGRSLVLAAGSDSALVLEDGFRYTISGWDEAFPSLEPDGDVPTLGYAIRGRAECWIENERLVSVWTVPGWHAVRRIEARGGTLFADYGFRNEGSSPAKLLWAPHVLFPLAGLKEAVLPARGLTAGPGCHLAELAHHATCDAGWMRISPTEPCGRSWKFFLEAEREAVLLYNDCTLRIAGDTGWLGVWYNLGRVGTPCLAIEPTNFPTDLRGEVPGSLDPQGVYSARWSLSVSI